jgi:hypothetical protein
MARATEYEVFIDVDTEEELYDLQETGQISDSTFQTLIELYRRGVDLNAASRDELYTLPNLTLEDVDAILAYREEAKYIDDPAQLVAAGALPRYKLDSVSMFLVVREPGRALAATNGFVKYRTTYVLEDQQVPPMTMQARVTTLRRLTVGGAATMTRTRLDDVRYDPNRDALSAKEAGVQLHVPKYFALWDDDKWAVMAGTYRIGFAQRLTFDNSSRYTPNGFYLDDAVVRSSDMVSACKESAGELGDSPCTGAAGRVFTTPDYRWSDSLRGAAVGAKQIDVKQGWLQAYGWFSHETRDVYQYEIYDRDACEDPRDPDDSCSAPDTFVRRDDPLEPTTRFKYSTLPDLYSETLGGGNFSYFYDRRLHFGVTGYGSHVNWLADGIDLDFQEYASRPVGGDFGAVGADVAWGRGWADLFLEGARSFDASPEGGGYATILRHTATWAKNEIEVSARYYDKKFANPYSGPISAPDEFEGNRARDEAGGRIRYNGLIAKRLNLRTFLDVWAEPSETIPKLRAFVRGDVQTTKWFRPGAWLAYDDKDLRVAGRGQCYDVTSFDDANPVPEFFIDPDDASAASGPCAGQRYQIVGRLRFDPHKRVNIQTQYQHEWQDDDNYPDAFRQDAAGHVIVASMPVDGFRLRARGKYLFEDIKDNTYLEQSFWAYLDASYDLKRHLLIRLRYDLRFWLDARDSTPERTPSPEHWLRLELTGKF